MSGRGVLSRVGLVTGSIVIAMLAVPARGSIIVSSEVLTAMETRDVEGMLAGEEEADRAIIANVPFVASLLFAGVGSPHGGLGGEPNGGLGGKGSDVASNWQGSRAASGPTLSDWVCFPPARVFIGAVGTRVFRPPETPC